MAKLETLVEDIYALFGSGIEPSPASLEEFGRAVASHVAEAFRKREPSGELRGSIMGTQCDRQLYYRTHFPEEQEDFQPHTLLKFLYGHILEELVLFLVENTKHKVEGRQHEVEIEGIKGHLDAIIDGTIVDSKSANTRSIEKFKKHELETNDPFGYIEQLNFYHEGMKDDPRVTNAGEIAFLAIDQELGHLVLDRYKAKSSEEVRRNIAEKLEIARNHDQVPPRGFMPEPDGKSGNLGLCTQCKYCAWKSRCWPSLRVFLYANGPRFLTHVERTPDVKEITSEYK